MLTLALLLVLHLVLLGWLEAAAGARADVYMGQFLEALADRPLEQRPAGTK
ncbi:hypothetical protein JQX13_32275 [Archangium violaceum]|uniref:hypothetical protein n=1 Tax=Archangium violaceum TaxID=83451 RepID=UPI00193C4BE2|nr:hypothetical protein [Archangium violaceum]QRK04880.1 hypothetical protein JQX13_32275 [Archangium violaceum]